MNLIRFGMCVAGIGAMIGGELMAATLVVLNKSEADVSLIDPESGETLARIDVGVGPHEAATSPDGKTVVVCNYGVREPGSSLSVIDIPTKSIVRTIDLERYHRPHGILFLDDDRVVVTAEQEQKLLIVNVRAGTVLEAIDTDQDISHMVAVTPDQRQAFVANIRGNSTSVIDLENASLTKVIPTGQGAEGVAAHQTRNEVWVTNRAADTISIIDTETLEIVEELECGVFPIRVAFTPDGTRALVSCARSAEVVVFDVAARSELKRVKMELQAREADGGGRLFGRMFEDSPVPIGILVQPDGTRAYIANTYADIVTVIDLDALEVTDRIETGKEPDGMAWTALNVR